MGPRVARVFVLSTGPSRIRPASDRFGASLRLAINRCLWAPSVRWRGYGLQGLVQIEPVARISLRHTAR